MKQLTHMQPSFLLVRSGRIESKYGTISYDDWCTREIIRLNKDIPNYAFRKNDKMGNICIVVNTKKLPEKIERFKGREWSDPALNIVRIIGGKGKKC